MCVDAIEDAHNSLAMRAESVSDSVTLELRQREALGAENIRVVFGPGRVQVHLPVVAPGQHVILRTTRNGQRILRSYTPVRSTESELEFLVRVYPSGAMTPLLRSVDIGSASFDCSRPLGGFSVDTLRARGVLMLSGGTGITPMLRLVRHMYEGGLATRQRQYGKCVLVASFHSAALRLAEQELASLADGDWLTVRWVLTDGTATTAASSVPSQADSAAAVGQLSGRIDAACVGHASELLRTRCSGIDPTQMSALVCGPVGFPESVAAHCRALRYGTVFVFS